MQRSGEANNGERRRPFWSSKTTRLSKSWLKRACYSHALRKRSVRMKWSRSHQLRKGTRCSLLPVSHRSSIQANLADREFCNPPLSALIARSNVAPARSRSADIPSSCINDEPPEQFDLSCCASPDPLPMLVFPLLPTALEPVRLDRF